MSERVEVMTSDDEFRLSITPGPGDLVLDALAENSRRIAELQAEQVRLLAEFAKLRPGRGARRFSEFAADEVAITLQLTRHAAHVRLDRAVTMTAQVPQVLQALETGAIDQWRADVIVDGVQRLPEDVALRVTDRVLDRAAELNVSEVRRILRRAIVRHDAAGAQRRERDARAGRRVDFTPCDDGMASLWAYLPASEATTINRRLDAFAREKVPGDDRTHDQRRADAFADLALNPALGPITATIHLTMPATALSGPTTEPAILDGYGPIPAPRARELALSYTPTDHATTAHATTAQAASQPASTVDGTSMDDSTRAGSTAAGTLRAASTMDSSSMDSGTVNGSTVNGSTEHGSAGDGRTQGGSAVDRSTEHDSTPNDSTPNDSIPAGSSQDGFVPDDPTPNDSTPVDSTSTNSTPADSTPADSTRDGPKLDGSTPDGSTGDRGCAPKLSPAAMWRRLVTDPVTGDAVGLGARGYRPTAALAEFVRARDQYCVFPGCLYPARACDIDHRVPWPDGPTAAGNLNCLCRHHHRLKQEDGWRLLKRGRSYVWINPAGIVYVRTPEPVAEPAPAPVAPPDEDPPPF